MGSDFGRYFCVAAFGVGCLLTLVYLKQPWKPSEMFEIFQIKVGAHESAEHSLGPERSRTVLTGPAPMAALSANVISTSTITSTSHQTFDAGKEPPSRPAPPLSPHLGAACTTGRDMWGMVNGGQVYTQGSPQTLALRKDCSAICNTSIAGKPGPLFDEIVGKHVNCLGLYSNTAADQGLKTNEPPRQPPPDLLNDYTQGGALKLEKARYYNNMWRGPSRPLRWKSSLIRKQISAYQNGTFDKAHMNSKCFGYSCADNAAMFALFQRNSGHIKDKHFLVIGSQSPWLESLLLATGARHVTTVEYRKIYSDHPQITTLLNEELRYQFLKSGGALPRFDGAATYSSIEHSGLGRYGDSLNPWGDLQAAARAWCIINPGGYMFIGVPSGRKDKLLCNPHRNYGPKRWPHLAANWRQTGDFSNGNFPYVFDPSGSDTQPMVAFQRWQPCEGGV